VDLVFVCNTADSALEIYDTRGLRPLGRVRVGLQPVSVLWVPSEGAAFTANRVGDSVSRVELEWRGAQLHCELARTMWVGDSPCGLAPLPGGRSLLVTLDTRSSVAWIRSDTLLAGEAGTLEEFELIDSLSSPREALRDPRAILWAGSKLHVLGYRSGQSYVHDSDLWTLDEAAGRVQADGGLGTFASNMRAGRGGELFVVGGAAQNALPSEDQLRQAPTGFVQSMLWWVQGAGTSTARILSRDLNLDESGKPVQPGRSLAHPMDVAVFDVPGEVRRLFVAAMHSDRIGVVEPNGADPARWPVRALDTQRRVGSRSLLAGPRGLAIKVARPGLAGDPGHRLYALQPFDASLVEIDPVSEKVLRVVALAADPEPERVVRGRAFFYGARFSGNGFVSCASCHLDGRSDGLGWRLSPESGPGGPFRDDLLDGLTDGRILGKTRYARDKGLMTTQSLQGLVNFEAPRESQALFSNRPYHWRGDRRTLLDFNTTYVSLQGMPNLAGASEDPRGISLEDMRALEDFLNSIHYEPNPEQPLDRQYSGELGDPDAHDGAGARLGLKLFHTEPWLDHQTGRPDPTLAGRSCVQCHELPEGSNNRLTRIGVSTPLPIETPGLRGVTARGNVLERDASSIGTIRLGEFGVEHQGTLRSVNDFNSFVFGHLVAPAQMGRLRAVTQFVRELDSGVAPSIGLAWTLDASDLGTALPQRLLDLCEGQVNAANAELLVEHWAGGLRQALLFDPIRGRYHETGAARSFTRAELLGLLANATPQPGRLIVQMLPLGSGRRHAELHATAPASSPPPSELRLEAMRPSTPWRDVPRLRRNWTPGPSSAAGDFTWTGVYSGTSTSVPIPPSLSSVRALQHGLLQDGPGLGLSALRHEAPRRFRVSGRNIQPGALLWLFVPNDPRQPPSTSSLQSTLPIRLPLFATSETSSNGAPIWETAAELEPRLAYALMLGGLAAPGVADALRGRWASAPPPKTFDPQTWNQHRLFVQNPDGRFGDGGLQSLRLH
jgi:hypothetical protein